MKGMLMDMMSAMMPLMKPLVWIALAAFVAGVALAFIKGNATLRMARLALWVVAGIGLFFVLAQFMGLWLGAQPSINFGDASKFEFILVPFWQLGIAALIGAFVLKWLLKRPTPGATT